MRKEAHTAELILKSAWRESHVANWKLAKAIFDFHEGGFWKWLGYATLEQYLAEPDLGMSRGYFFKLSQTWRDLVEVKQIAPDRLEHLELSKVAEVRKAIMDGKVPVDKGLDDAEAMGQRDLREHYGKRDFREVTEAERQAAHDAELDASIDDGSDLEEVSGEVVAEEPDESLVNETPGKQVTITFDAGDVRVFLDQQQKLNGLPETKRVLAALEDAVL